MTVFNPAALTATPDAVAQALTLNGAPAALLSITDGARSAHGASGASDLTTGVTAQAGQTFEVGSQTKMITSVVLLKLAEDGLVDLDAPIGDYLPAEMLDGIANASEATLREALAMRSGIPSYTDQEDADGNELFDIITYENPDILIGTEVALDLVRGVPAAFAPGDGYEYSNTAYALLGKVIESVTGESLGDAMEALVFAPLGMSDTKLDDHGTDPARLSSYLTVDEGLLDVTYALQEQFAEGGVISTTADMTTFLQALLIDQTLLSPEALSQMLAFGDTDTDGMGFGLGLVVLQDASYGTLLGFPGGTLGTDSATFLHLESGRILSAAVTTTDLDADAVAGIVAALELVAEDPAWTPADGADPLQIEGVSAADLEVTETEDGAEIAAEGANLQIDASLADLTRVDFVFEDGSILLTGSDSHDRIALRKSDAAYTADNQLIGLEGDDRLRAGSGDDTLSGGTGQDRLKGLDGDDRLHGGDGDDRLKAGAGADVLIGGAGDDRMVGGAGADVFVFGDSTGNGVVETDRIRDFNAAEDALFLGGVEIADIQERQNHVLVTFEGEGDLLIVQGVSDAEAITLL
ncbi:MAG: serine hydrolase [Pseudomonadota bacterium]